MEGHEVLKRLRARRETASIPCIALSANAMTEDIERALAAGFADYWTKPIDLGGFLAGIDALFGA
jgi:CheY-like chemotaxis protein